MPAKKNQVKVTEQMRDRSRAIKEEERQVDQIVKQMHSIYLRNIYDAFRSLPEEPKRLVLKAYRKAFRDDARRMKELEDTHPNKK